MKRFIPILFLSMALHAQILVNAGGPATGTYAADQGFTGGAAYGPNSQSDPGWKAQTGIYATLRYGAAFSYDFPVSNGSCAVKLDLMENRPAVATSTVTAAAIGARTNFMTSGPNAYGILSYVNGDGPTTNVLSLVES